MRTIVRTIPKELIVERTKFFFFLFLLFFALQSKAQISVSINVNARTNRVYEPAPAPRHVHSNYCHHEEVVDYYYYPEIEAYFDIRSSVFIYYASNGWVRSRYLPRHCDDYDINRGYRVGLDYHGHRPYNYFQEHKAKYKCKGYKKVHKHKKHKKYRDDD